MQSDFGIDGWTAFRFNPQILEGIREAGFAQPSAIQEKCIPLIMGGQEVIGIAQTGTGKTAAYVLPVLMKTRYAQGHDPRVLILGPTKELVIQLADHARALAKHTGIRIAALYGGIGPRAQIQEIQSGIDIIVATPGRFLELYQTGELPVKQIKTLILDEADRLMDMGFIGQLRKIFEVVPQKRQNLLFSATFSPKVEQLSTEFLEFPVKVEITPASTPAKQVVQELYHVPNLKTKINFLTYLLSRPEFDRVMVFTKTKEAADNVFKFVERKGLGPVKVIHSNKGQQSRINAINDFKNGKIRVLVSTDVSARGIDISKVTHVINFDVPILYEDYVHRIGRTGRADHNGTAITMATDAETYHLAGIEKLIRNKIPLKALPGDVEIAPTSKEEAQVMAREIDRQKKRMDPTFRGAFHDRRK